MRSGKRLDPLFAVASHHEYLNNSSYASLLNRQHTRMRKYTRSSKQLSAAQSERCDTVGTAQDSERRNNNTLLSKRGEVTATNQEVRINLTFKKQKR